jgi:hypothetical protein
MQEEDAMQKDAMQKDAMQEDAIPPLWFSPPG